MKYKIFNHSSESMSEIDEESIDLAIFSPPYNIKTYYGNFDDDLDLDKYIYFIKNVILEISKKLNKNGKLIIEISDSIFTDNKYIQLAGLVQKFAVLDCNLFLETRHINFVNSDNGFELPDHGFDENYITKEYSHSNCHQILVFSKSKVKQYSGDILYINYISVPEHPCPQPKAIIDFILGKYFVKEMKVLDPFMGTANLGVEVLKRNGIFYGYEIVEEFYNTAKRKLDLI
jgi:DNA modification methylase